MLVVKIWNEVRQYLVNSDGGQTMQNDNSNPDLTSSIYGRQSMVYAATPKLLESSPEPAVQTHQFEFTGTANEYFRIWIVNVFLSVITLGIYSAWAKVRTRQYFYANTKLDGHPFEYLGNPIAILKGNLVVGLARFCTRWHNASIRLSALVLRLLDTVFFRF